MDPIDKKRQESKRLTEQILVQEEELRHLIQSVANARLEAERAINSFTKSVEEAYEDYIKYLESVQLIQRETGKIVVKRRKRG